VTSNDEQTLVIYASTFKSVFYRPRRIGLISEYREGGLPKASMKNQVLPNHAQAMALRPGVEASIHTREVSL